MIARFLRKIRGSPGPANLQLSLDTHVKCVDNKLLVKIFPPFFQWA